VSDEGGGAGKVEAPETHGHAHHGGTGIRWLDMTLALAALFTSVVSLWLALEHGHDMAKLVQANSYPYLQIGQSDVEQDGVTEVSRLEVINEGVGPARIADVRVTVDGKPVRDLNHLLDACCAPGYLASTGPDFAGIHKGEILKSTAIDRMVRAGQSFDMIHWKTTPANRAVSRRLLDQLGGRVRVSLCYCSVFDECWTRALGDHVPERAKICPPDPMPYTS
jgi:hypothetical protein